MRALNPCLRALALAIPMTLVACGGEDEGTGPNVAGSESEVTFTTGEFEIPVGDSFTCFYLDQFTDREMPVVSAYGTQGPGGHHILVYYAEQTREPGYHTCADEEMLSLRQVSGASGPNDATAAEGSLMQLPDGLALNVPKGKQVVLQAHYINTTGQPMKVTDTVTLQLAKTEEIQAYVNYLALIDFGFSAPPQTKYTHTSECKLDRDYDIALALGHMHEHGSHYKIETLKEDGSVAEVLRDEKWESLYASHPPVSKFPLDKPMQLKKGTTLRQTCTWDNNTAEPLMFPREMCLAFLYYFPGDGDVECDMEGVENVQ